MGGETDIYTNTTILGNCAEAGRLLDDPVTATLTTNDDNEDGWAVEWAQITKSTGKMFYCTFNAWFKVKDSENRSSVTVNCTNSGLANEGDTIILVTGGYNGGEISSSELFPSIDDYTLPSLPQPTEGPVLFATAEQNQTVAVCGGYITGTGHVTSCLMLNRETFSWDGNIMGSLPRYRYGSAVV